MTISMMGISRRHLIQTAAGIAAIAGAAQPAAAQAARGGSIRSRFALAPDLVYVNAANLCPTFLSAIAAEKAESAALQQDPSQEYRARYNGMVATVHARLARQLGTVPAAIALTRNCSESSGVISRGVRLQAGDEVIIGRENHPSNTNWWKRRADTQGIVVKIADPANEPKNPQEVLDAYLSLATPRTKVIALSHQTNIAGLIAPVAEIGRFARSRNIWFHLDCAQTMGWMKLDMAAIGCDSASGSTHKWMMCPIGGGVLYVRPERIGELDPLIMSVDYYHTGGRDDVNGQLFEYVGQRPDAMLPGLLAALDERDAIGQEEIERITRANAMLVRRKLESKGIKVYGSGDPALWGPVLAANIKGLPGSRATLYKDQKVAGSGTRVGTEAAFRISPHIYNTADELDRLVTLVA